MKNRIIAFVLIFAVSAFIVNSDGGIKTENSNYLIDWELEVTGYSPHSGTFILEGAKKKCLSLLRKKSELIHQMF